MAGLKDTDPEFFAADRLMHELWTHDVGSPGYDKRKWQQLEAAIHVLAKRTCLTHAVKP